MDDKINTSVENIDSQESTTDSNENRDTSLLPTPITELTTESPNIATLTTEIKMYL